MEREFPKNVRQIGNVCDEPKIYVEDYVDTYLNQLREKAVEAPVGVALAGEMCIVDGHDVVYISGALQMRDITVDGTDIIIEENVWEELKQMMNMYFPEQEIVGWGLIETGHPMSLSRGVHKLHSQHFPKENTVFIWRDAIDPEEIFYASKFGELMQMGGHYIYYEKNPSMQNYMITTRKMNGVTPSEMVEDRAAKDFRSAVSKKREYREQRANSRFVYAMSAALVVVVLAIGISTMNNFDKMEAVQDSLETLSQAVSQPQSQTEPAAEDISTQEGDDPVENVPEEETKVTAEESKPASGGTVPETSIIQEQLSEGDYYTVKKGDTLDKISKKHYGDTKHVDAICRMNGLDDGNLIYIGQKILLP